MAVGIRSNEEIEASAWWQAMGPLELGAVETKEGWLGFIFSFFLIFECLNVEGSIGAQFFAICSYKVTDA